MDDLFYFPNIPLEGSFELDDENFHHIVKVLRYEDQTTLFFTDGNGRLVEGKLTLLSKKNAVVDVLKSEYKKSLTNLNIHVFAGLLKQNQRYEWMVEKLGELDVRKLTPLLSERTIKNPASIERLKKIAVSAMKQSKNPWLLTIDPPEKFEHIVKNYGGQFSFICHENKLENSRFIQHLTLERGQQEIFLLIGPEGGFSDKEIELAITNHWNPIFLGSMRFRTETAAIVGVSAIIQKAMT